MDTHEALAFLFSPTYLRNMITLFPLGMHLRRPVKGYVYRWHVVIGKVTELVSGDMRKP